MQQLMLKHMLEHFFKEDIGWGDLTSQAVFSEDHICEAAISAKENGVFAGAMVIKEGFALIDQKIAVDINKKDGEPVATGEVIARLKGPAASLLTGERVVLNLIQRMSGIATLTKRSVMRLNDPDIRICDTRKTTPGLRMLEKYAVKIGGGFNHRFGLDGGIMIKDNHIAACGSIGKAVEKARAACGHMVKIEVEIESEKELAEAVEAGADIIMFDNCPPETVRRFSDMTPPGIITEASGGISFENLPAYRGTGVDYISLGYLTHSAKAVDFSMNVNLNKMIGLER
ncbi:carboxylating nicotinate-nucleotide diphosphorylase [Bacillus sonorensis]|uniref:nicotinate-nucleotide diphosphorylase (carboxylating) n=2 Tax=Bacillus sonorensis TaxID=119858 RepID=A0ABM6LGG5_9BACI|nr:MULTISPECIES: carboxylating nicotinate-nucleotide diphosphorylase [Bacillus]TWK78990.1 putative nicotinate-nucleotide pyrophosphorylase [carboxylating] [Bacillus paralicheniformis]ASB88085.1 Nicotinate-nucleotide diphosphorylase (carboxylating) [Bacillus sonorensis]EME75151.1 nicotinate-nucleotide pyrophosphorylase [Bacillus sonorensis L12]MBG9915962.1 nicotinate-nucleotide pyrophosphorylase [Bacillus sonorensis]MCF7617486.1 carboxylating nicotinate-nucleotide diphosphorylase [Bacillus sono